MTDVRSLRPQIRRANRLQRFYTTRAAAQHTLQNRDATAVDRAMATAALFAAAFDFWRATVKRLPPSSRTPSGSGQPRCSCRTRCPWRTRQGWRRWPDMTVATRGDENGSKPTPTDPAWGTADTTKPNPDQGEQEVASRERAQGRAIAPTRVGRLRDRGRSTASSAAKLTSRYTSTPDAWS